PDRGRRRGQGLGLVQERRLDGDAAEITGGAAERQAHRHQRQVSSNTADLRPSLKGRDALRCVIASPSKAKGEAIQTTKGWIASSRFGIRLALLAMTTRRPSATPRRARLCPAALLRPAPAGCARSPRARACPAAGAPPRAAICRAAPAPP